MHTLWVFLGEVWHVARRRPMAASVGLLGNIYFITVSVIVPLLVGRVIELATPGGSRESLMQIAAVWAGIVVFWLIAEWMVAWAAAELLSEYSHQARRLAIGSVHISPVNDGDPGGITTRLTSDVDAIEEGLREFVTGSLAYLGRLIFVSIALTRIQPQLGLLLIFGLIVFGVLQRVAAKHVDRANLQRQDNVDVMSSKVAETLASVAVIRAYKVDEWDARRFGVHNDELRRHTRRRMMVGWWPWWIGAMVGQVALLVILICAAALAQSAITTVAVVAASILYAQIAVGDLRQLSQSMPMYQRAGASVVRLRELTHTMLPEHAAPASSDSQSGSDADVVLRDVNVVMEGGRHVLFDVSLRLPFGQWTTIVGASGAGKSTTLNLIAGFVDPSSGNVSVAGLSSSEARHTLPVSIVFQVPLLFNASIAENVRVGKLDATDEEVENAIGMADLTELLAEIPGGLEAVVSSQTTSGGQRQRLSLARALLREPRLLLLDEPTSSLDPHTAASIWQSMRTLAREQGITVVAVCHSLDLARDSDRIVVLDAGRVVEEGSPAVLDASAGIWSQMDDSSKRMAANDTAAVIRLMGQHPVLFPTDSELTAVLAGRSMMIDATKGELVCSQGDLLDSIILVNSGLLEVIDGSATYQLGAGSALGSLNDIATGTSRVTARVLAAGQLVLVPRLALLPSLFDLLEAAPHTAAAMTWLVRQGSVSKAQLVERLGPDGVAILRGLILSGRLMEVDDDSVQFVMAHRRGSNSSSLQSLEWE